MKTKRLFSFIMAVIMIFSICTFSPMKISIPLETNAATDVSNLEPVDSTYSLIKSLEGCDLNCFWDVAQWTIGYGNKCPYTHNSNGTYWHQPGGHSISESEARSLFSSKLSIYVNTLKSNCSGLSMTQNQFDALLSATYNHGNVKNCPLKYYLQGELTEAEAREQYYVWCINAGTKDEKGLRNRRKKEADVFFSDPDPNPPTNVTLSKNQMWYDIKDTIKLNANSDNANTYWISVLKDGASIINTQISGEFSFSAFDYGYGEYEAWVSAVNSAGSTDSSHINFPVVDKPGYSEISSLKPIYTSDETVSISVSTICAKGQVIGIDKIGTGRIITEDCDSTYTISSNQLGAGEYSAYFSVYNGSGSIDTERVSFTIYDESSLLNMKSPTVCTDKKYYYKNGSKVDISWNKTEGATGYWIDIYKDDEHIISEDLKNAMSYSGEFSSGEYYVFVAAYNSYNGWNTAVSEICEFSVYDESLASDIKPPIVHTESKYYKPDSEVTISWNEVETAAGYWIDIYKNDEHIISENLENVTSYSDTFSTGEYDIYVAAYNLYNDWNTAVSEVYEFSVYEKGDINSDGKVTVADAVMLKKWLLAVPNAKLDNWKSADLYDDGRIDVFDMVEMRKLLIENK